MQDSLALPLPPLRRKILGSFFFIVGLYGLLGAFFLAAIFFASGVTPRVLHVNYDSITAAIQMQKALNGLRHPGDSPRESPGALRVLFEKSLLFEEGNVTEPGEEEIAREIRGLWDESKTDLGSMASDSFGPTYIRMSRLLSDIIRLNQTAMFAVAESSLIFRNRVLLISGLIFLGTLIVALYLADGLAVRIASPIKAIAEALKNKPIPGEKLKLPTPTSLEIRILTFEMNQLWKRLSELRKLNVEELATQRSKLETVLESVEDGIIVVDSAGNVLQCNQGLMKIIGLPSEMVIGHRWRDLPTSDEDYLRLREKLTPGMMENDTIELQVDQETRFFGCRRRVIKTKEREVSATLYLLHDITERKQRERLKSEFIAVLSHELKTPLQSLGTAAELLMKRRGELNEEGRMLVETINEDVARIRAVADDFMQVSFVDPHSLKLKISRHAISELIQEWAKPFAVLAKDKQVTLNVERQGPDVIWADIDAVKFPWAISNLLSNAVRFSPKESKVKVILAENQKGIQIEIRDEGPGIPEALQRKMFDPYFQAPVGESSIPSGFLGLGLTIAKEVVEAHHGQIEYHPGSPRGSIFRIRLPHAGSKEVPA